MSRELWSVHFSSPSLIFGSGIAIMDGDSIMGGDGTFYYLGKRTRQGSSATAIVDIIPHSPGMSIFGNIGEFTLMLTGNILPNYIVFSGNILHQSHFKISGTMKKISVEFDNEGLCRKQSENLSAANLC